MNDCNHTRLSRSFFGRPCVEVARGLIGSRLTVVADGQAVSGRIVEVEAYLGAQDAASHAAQGPTKRARIMYGPPAVVYVYLIYGMHHCLNFVTESHGVAGAVLVRALEPLSGVDVMISRRGDFPQHQLANGPGKLCKTCGIDISWNGLLIGRNDQTDKRLWLTANQASNVRIGVGKRIGIRKAQDLPYRFVDRDSDCLSSPV